MAYDDSNRGAAFPNQRKQNEKHPDYTGKGNYAGVDFEISIWKRRSKNGNPFLSIAFKEPYQKPERTESTSRPDPMDDDDWG